VRCVGTSPKNLLLLGGTLREDFGKNNSCKKKQKNHAPQHGPWFHRGLKYTGDRHEGGRVECGGEA